MQVKICGITRLEDALFAEKLGANFIGLIFSKHSKRQVTLKQAQQICQALTQAKPVGVFVEHTTAEIQNIADHLALQHVQLYSDHNLPQLMTLRALRIKKKSDLSLLKNNHYDFYVIDTYQANAYGGTGEAFDWSLLPQDKSKIFIAGGITPDNVQSACALKPYAIDLASGVEQAPGIKDADKLTQLFSRIKDGKF